jgi:Protein of unknown function (DUF3137)
MDHRALGAIKTNKSQAPPMREDVRNELKTYYNTTMYPVLWRMERLRHKTLLFLTLGFILLLIFLVAEIFLEVPFLNLLFLFMAAGLVAWAFDRMNHYRTTFKPQVVGMLLDYLDNQASYNDFKYHQFDKISPALFVRSKLFGSDFASYDGEDMIIGRIGDLNFALCELTVETMSPIRSKTDTLFKGVFVHVRSSIRNQGDVVIWPRSLRENWSEYVETFVKEGAKQVDDDMKNAVFSRHYAVFASADAWVDARFSDEMEAEMIQYIETLKRPIAMSFIGQDIFIALWQERDLLEPMLFKDNNTFDLVSEFADDLDFVFRIIQDLDASN